LIPGKQQLNTLARSSFLSLGLVLFITFFNQLVARMINQTTSWSYERETQVTTVFTYFYFFASLLILWGIWLGPASRSM
jgi:hypothetical protein